MAKKPRPANIQVDWLLRNKRMSAGLDHLGVQLVSVSLYTQLLPGITNVTDRVRFYAFYPWLIHRYAKAGLDAGDRRRWLEWFRPAELTYALSCAAAAKLDGDDITGVTGSLIARRQVRKLDPAASVDVRSSAMLDEAGKIPESAYIDSPQGGFGQYDNALRMLGILFPAPQLRYPDLQITAYAGKAIVDTLDDPGAGFLDLLTVAREGRATVAELADIGRRVQPGAIRPGSQEQRLLRAAILGDEDAESRGQNGTEREWRRASLLLALVFVRDCETLDESFPETFRWSCANRFLPTGERWHVPSGLEQVARAWATYHRNDLLCVALDALLYSALLDLNEEPLAPRALARSCAERALRAINVSDDESLPALGGRVATFVEACRLPVGDDEEAQAWGAGSTYVWTNALFEAVNDQDQPRICALALRLLGRLTTDTGAFLEHGFGVFPSGTATAEKFDVHLGTWLDRAQERREAPLHAFFEELVLEWVLFRHLRVATRKLASQGLSTFKFRPEEGRLVRLSSEMPTVGFTSPRLRQAYRYLVDLGYVHESADGAQLSEDGRRTLIEAGL
jgi:hypothetical protein